MKAFNTLFYNSLLEEAKKKKWIQKAVKKMKKKGTEGSFRKYCGGSVSQACINKAAKAGGAVAKKAAFAAAVSKGKYSYPKKSKD